MVGGGDELDGDDGNIMLLLIALAHTSAASNAFMCRDTEDLADDDNTDDDIDAESAMMQVKTFAGICSEAEIEEGAVTMDAMTGGGVATKTMSES